MYVEVGKDCGLRRHEVEVAFVANYLRLPCVWWRFVALIACMQGSKQTSKRSDASAENVRNQAVKTTHVMD